MDIDQNDVTIPTFRIKVGIEDSATTPVSCVAGMPRGEKTTNTHTACHSAALDSHCNQCGGKNAGFPIHFTEGSPFWLTEKVEMESPFGKT